MPTIPNTSLPKTISGVPSSLISTIYGVASVVYCDAVVDLKRKFVSVPPVLAKIYRKPDAFTITTSGAEDAFPIKFAIAG